MTEHLTRADADGPVRLDAAAVAGLRQNSIV